MVALWPHGAWLGSKGSDGHSRGVSHLDFCPERQLLLAAVGRVVKVYNPVLAERVISLTGHESSVERVCGTIPSLILSADTTCNVRVFDSLCYEPLQSFSLSPSALPKGTVMNLPKGAPPTLHHFVPLSSRTLLMATAAKEGKPASPRR